jgi:hypothetical protein
MKKQYHLSAIYDYADEPFNTGTCQPVLIAEKKNHLKMHHRKEGILLKTAMTTLILLLSYSLAQAVTYYSIASAAWNVNSTWSTVGYASSTNTGTFPKAGDVVNIGNSRTVTVSAANAACATIVIDATGVLNPSGSRTITASTSITINGT